MRKRDSCSWYIGLRHTPPTAATADKNPKNPWHEVDLLAGMPHRNVNAGKRVGAVVSHNHPRIQLHSALRATRFSTESYAMCSDLYVSLNVCWSQFLDPRATANAFSSPMPIRSRPRQMTLDNGKTSDFTSFNLRVTAQGAKVDV